MDRLTLMPTLLALFIGLAAMPRNIYKICAWNAGTMALDPWRKRTAAAIGTVAQGIRSWLSLLWTHRIAFACLAVLIAVMVAQLGAEHHDGLQVAVAAPAALLAKRATLLREAAALKNPDGSFADDAKRQAFDAKMAEVEAIDAPSETLDERNRPAAEDADPETGDHPNERDQGATAERARVQGIRQACIAGRMSRAFEDKLISDGLPLVDAQTRIFAELSKRDQSDRGPRPGSGPSGSIMASGDDPLIHVRAGIENAIMHRVAPEFFKLEDIGRPYRGMSLLDVARSYLNARGARTTDLSRIELAGLALGLTQRGGMHSTSDFPLLVADVARKTLRAAYEESPQTFKSIGRQVSLPDFKQTNRMQIGDAPALLEVKEHGEFTRGTFVEGKEVLQLKTFGRVFAITRQALINDDTSAFARVPTAFGRTARTLESDIVWQQITSNPVMGDGVTLFHATHGNLDAVPSLISVTSLSKGRAAMRIQKGLDGTTLLNIAPEYLATPASLETTAATFLVQITPALPTSVNPFAGLLKPLVEPRLDANSLTAWYLFAGASADLIEYAYLDGQAGPMVDDRIGFDIDGLEIKCRLDFGAKVIDWRGIWKNPGV